MGIADAVSGSRGDLAVLEQGSTQRRLDIPSSPTAAPIDRTDRRANQLTPEHMCSHAAAVRPSTRPAAGVSARKAKRIPSGTFAPRAGSRDGTRWKLGRARVEVSGIQWGVRGQGSEP